MKSSIKPVFRKRVFTLSSFFQHLGRTGLRLPSLFSALRHPATSASMREQVMLAVTSVNDCRYCAWAHTHLALKEGVNLSELQSQLDHSSTLKDEKSATAILFAQHFAEQQAQPSAEAMQRLHQAFTDEQVQELLTYMQAIYFANLSGNSFDALLARFRGFEVKDSSISAELISSLISWPVLVAIRIAARKDRKVGIAGLS